MLRSDRGPRRALWFIDDAGEFPAIEMGHKEEGEENRAQRRCQNTASPTASGLRNVTHAYKPVME